MTSDVVIQSDFHQIQSFDGLDIFKGISEIRAPVIGSRKKAETAHLQTLNVMKPLDRLSVEDIENFVDHLTDFVREDISYEEAERLFDEIGSDGEVGDLIVRIHESFEHYVKETGEKAKYYTSALMNSINQLNEIHNRLGREVIDCENDESFEQILIVQTILLRVIKELEFTRNYIRKKRSVDDRAVSNLILALVGMLRIEAFRRGKIDVDLLYDTMTSLISDDNVPESIITFRSPDWVLGY